MRRRAQERKSSAQQAPGDLSFRSQRWLSEADRTARGTQPTAQAGEATPMEVPLNKMSSMRWRCWLCCVPTSRRGYASEGWRRGGKRPSLQGKRVCLKDGAVARMTHARNPPQGVDLAALRSTRACALGDAPTRCRHCCR
eukprot:9725767-Alexandrium_andersonii.AAC.1